MSLMKAGTLLMRGGWFSRKHIRELLKEETLARRKSELPFFWTEEWHLFYSRFHITGYETDVKQVIARIEHWLQTRAA